MKSKKSVIELQFHWMFVLAAGAIILLFFTGIIIKQKGTQELIVSEDVSNDIEAIMSGAVVSADTTHLIPLPKVEVEVDCDKYYLKGIPKPIGPKVVFSPDLLKGRVIIPFTNSWGMPFKVDNFLYLTTDQVKYVFVNNDNPDIWLDYDMYLALKNVSKTWKELGDVTSLQDTNNYKVRFIFFEQSSLPANLPVSGEITAINIKKNIIDDTFDYGELEFFKYDKTTSTFELIDTSAYIGDASIIGAIVTENPEVYNCVMEKAFRRLNMMAETYSKKVQLLDQDFSNYMPGSSCRISGYYSGANLQNALAFLGSAEFETYESSMEAVNAYVTIIIGYNQALQFASCPLIY